MTKHELLEYIVDRTKKLVTQEDIAKELTHLKIKNLTKRHPTTFWHSRDVSKFSIQNGIRRQPKKDYRKKETKFRSTKGKAAIYGGNVKLAKKELNDTKVLSEIILDAEILPELKIELLKILKGA